MRTSSPATPRRSRSVASRCFSGKRGSKRYTRTLVSTSASTPVEVLARPAALLQRPGRTAGRVPFALPGGRLIEQFEPCLGVERFPHRGAHPHHPDGISRREPFDLIAGRDPVLVGDHLRDRNLAFARHPAHVLTIVRTESLSTR